MFFTSPNNYTFSTGGFDITLNALGTDRIGRNYTQCYTVSGAKLYVYINDPVAGIRILRRVLTGEEAGDMPDTLLDTVYARDYDILCYPTHFTTDAQVYVYAAIPRSESADQTATIVYPTREIDLFGCIEVAGEDGEKTEQQVGDPDYYYINLGGKISDAYEHERQWLTRIIQGAINGYIIGDAAAITRGNGQVTEQMVNEKISQLKEYIESNLFFERYPMGEPFQETVEDPETGELVPKTEQKKDADGNLLYWTTEDHEDQTTEVTDYPVMEPVMNINTAVRLKPKFLGLFSMGWLSAYGINGTGSGTGSGSGGSYPRLDSWSQYIESGEDEDGNQIAGTEKWVLSAKLGWELYNNGGGGQLSPNEWTQKAAFTDKKGLASNLGWELYEKTKEISETTAAALSLLEYKIRTIKPNLFWANLPTQSEAMTDTEPVFGAITIGGAKITWDADHQCLVSDKGVVSLSFVSAYGVNGENAGSGGGSSVNVIDSLTSYDRTAALSANQGRELKALIDALSGGSGENDHNHANKDVLDGITATLVGNWNTAYGWGDHAAAGYLKGNQTITLTGVVTGSGTTSITTSIGAGKITNDMLAGGIPNSKLQNNSMSLWGNVVALGGTTNGAITIKNANGKAVTLSVTADGYLEVGGGMYSTSFVSAYGLNGENNSGGTGSIVSFTPSLTSGTAIGSITIDGTKQTIYAPNGGASSWSEISDKPFVSIGTGLSVTNGVLSATATGGVTSVGGKAGEITLLGSQTTDGSINLAIDANKQISASLIGWANKRNNTAPKQGEWFAGTPLIESTGVMEVGRYIDFHPTNTSTLDYNVRLDAGASTTARIFQFPDTSGTLVVAADLNKYVKKAGDTMTGALKRYYGAASDDPMIGMTSNNQDVWLWRISHASSETFAYGNTGYGLKYIGTGSGIENALTLYSDGYNPSTGVSTRLAAVSILQDGKIGLGVQIPSYRLHVITSEYETMLLSRNAQNGGVGIVFQNTAGRLGRFGFSDGEGFRFDLGSNNTKRFLLGEDGTISLYSSNGKAVTLKVTTDGYLEVGGGMYSTSFVSAYGLNGENNSGGGSNVTIKGLLNSGTTIGTITVDGKDYVLKAPSGSGGDTGNYLSLNGGTLTNASFGGQLEIYRSSNNGVPAIKYTSQNQSGTKYTVGYIGMRPNLTGSENNYPFWSNDSNTLYKLWSEKDYSLKTISAAAALNAAYSVIATDNKIVPTMAFLSWWNGRYNSTSSNLAYCNQGAFGSVVTHAHSDYVTSLSFSNNKLQYSMGGTAQTAITIGYATSAGSATTADSATTSGSCTGNAATATKLYTSRTLWGQDFDGSKNVTGNMTSVGSISASDNIYISASNTTANTGFGVSTANGGMQMIVSSSNKGLWDNEAGYWILARSSEDRTKTKIPDKLCIGDFAAYFWYDATNKCIRTNVGFASDSFVSSYGANNSGEIANIKNISFDGSKLQMVGETGSGKATELQLGKIDGTAPSYGKLTLCGGGTAPAPSIYASGSNLVLYGYSSTEFHVYAGSDKNVLTLSSGSLTPATTDAFSLGSSTKRFNYTYTKYLYVNGSSVTSDMRLKDVLEDVDVSVSDIANAPVFEYRMKDEVDGDVLVGTSAQYWMNVLPSAVRKGDNGLLSLNYDGVTMAACVALAKKSVNHEERIKALEEENLRLKERIVELEK